MEKMTASRAKQNFGELLDALAKGPVAIERHKSIKAVICSPETFHGTVGHISLPSQALAERRAARTAQQLVEKNRLIRHQKLAIDLLLMPQDKREELVLRARAEVSRWRRDRLCSKTMQIAGTTFWVTPLGIWRAPCAQRRLNGAPL
jgi:PHD/YefM family antitoxin component YafN of YafNO toxin-antitoxin module